jgi:hypothetical protein
MGSRESEVPMRSLVLLSILALSSPALAEDTPSDEAAESGETRDAKAEYAKVVKLVDEWFAARDADQPRAEGVVDGKLKWWYQQELADERRVGEIAAADSGGKAKKKKGDRADLGDAADMLDSGGAAKNYPRLRAVTQELADMQPRFDRMEATAVVYMDKARKLRELQELARAEITADKPPAPKVADLDDLPEQGGEDAKSEVADLPGPGTSQAPAVAAPVKAAVAPPPPPKREVLDEPLDEKQAKKEAKKAKAPKEKKAKKPKEAAAEPAGPRGIEDLDE